MGAGHRPLCGGEGEGERRGGRGSEIHDSRLKDLYQRANEHGDVQSSIAE